MKILTDATVFALRTREYLLPEFGAGVGVILREMSAPESLEYWEMVKGADDKADTDQMFQADPWLFSRCIIDDKGAPIFTEAQLSPIPARLRNHAAAMRGIIIDLSMPQVKK